ncbi:hypothetical protein PAHAL_2G265100 [Panicum hallii]|uniref:Uncharacterized protein n=1 Tax=Panicum hallii TaxID=206008 RepID=A0A2T8KQH8_9POAL|nr:hypothetical protein PAHAL_2G265100 [Panicum hallii]
MVAYGSATPQPHAIVEGDSLLVSEPQCFGDHATTLPLRLTVSWSSSVPPPPELGEHDADEASRTAPAMEAVKRSTVSPSLPSTRIRSRTRSSSRPTRRRGAPAPRAPPGTAPRGLDQAGAGGNLIREGLVDGDEAEFRVPRGVGRVEFRVEHGDAEAPHVEEHRELEHRGGGAPRQEGEQHNAAAGGRAPVAGHLWC